MHLPDLQAFMIESRIAGWLVFDFRGSNPTLARLLPLPAGHPTGRRFTTRRALLWVPQRGEPVLLSHHIDRGAFEGARLAGSVAPLRIDGYLTWGELHAWIAARVAEAGAMNGGPRLAMEYAPGGSLPVVSVVDAGTVELVRALGAEVVSSANLIQAAIARWSGAALESHEWASREVARVKDSAFALVRERLRAGAPVTEADVHRHIHAEFKRAGLETPDGPVVAVNEHGADPHFEVSLDDPAPIRHGDWVLLDLWARRPGDEHIFSDITWVAYAPGPGPAASVPARHRRAFEAVKAARDAAVALAQSRHGDRRAVQGWELDDAARAKIVEAGFGPYIRHRTGHSLSAGPMVHGVGVNIDNLETHDTRDLLPRVGFTVEPGVYIPTGPDAPGFGVRLEINLYVDPATGPRVTSCIQDDVVPL